MKLFPTELIGISYLAAGDETGDRRSERLREGERERGIFFYQINGPNIMSFLGQQTFQSWKPFWYKSQDG